MCSPPRPASSPHNDLRTKIVIETAGGLAGKRVVDVGCNEGGFAVELARHGAAETVGVERASSASDGASSSAISSG